MPDIRPDFPELQLPERVTEEASWAACDALFDLITAHPDDKGYILARYFDAFAEWKLNQQLKQGD